MKSEAEKTAKEVVKRRDLRLKHEEAHRKLKSGQKANSMPIPSYLKDKDDDGSGLRGIPRDDAYYQHPKIREQQAKYQEVQSEIDENGDIRAVFFGKF